MWDAAQRVPTALTLTGQVLGTPNYMPPEQARGRRHEIGPHSDVFSLGGILFFLLTGRPPFLGETLEETLSQVLHTDPISPRLLNPSVPRDLETICLKCLEKEPARRYQTAHALALDLDRHLSHEPISARPPSVWYRGQKFVRKHRVPVTIGGVSVLLLAAATVVSLALAVSANRERTKAIKARTETEKAEKEARTKAADAFAVLDFLRDHVLAAARPAGQGGGLGTDVTLRRAVEAAEPQVARLFKDRPTVEAEIRSAIGLTYLYLGDNTNAIRQLDPALIFAKAISGIEHPSTIPYVDNLAMAYQRAGRWAESVPLFERALELRKASLGPEHTNTLHSMNNLAMAYLDLGRVTEALPLLEYARRVEAARQGPAHAATLTLSHNLALAYAKAGRSAEAVALFEEVVDRRKTNLGPKHPDTLKSMNALAQTYRRGGRNGDAIPLLEETLKLRLVVLGTKHAETLETIYSLGGAYREAGRLKDAIPLAEQAFAGRRARLGADHPDTLYAMNSLASTYREAGRLTEAAALIEQERSLREARFGRRISPRSRPSIIWPKSIWNWVGCRKPCRCSRPPFGSEKTRWGRNIPTRSKPWSASPWRTRLRGGRLNRWRCFSKP
jgi:tetratricopeptide (TPR) repeat protein